VPLQALGNHISSDLRAGKQEAAVADLPGTFLRDTADRIIVATARIMGAALLTNDTRIRDAGIVQTV